jgi:uncharacterized protein YprB with RNaseH-like and TPR domain
LKEVAECFGIPRVSGVLDGLQAQLLFGEYLRTREEGLRNQLLEYNRDDLDGLIATTVRLRALASSRRGVPRKVLP